MSEYVVKSAWEFTDISVRPLGGRPPVVIHLSKILLFLHFILTAGVERSMHRLINCSEKVLYFTNVLQKVGNCLEKGNMQGTVPRSTDKRES